MVNELPELLVADVEAWRAWLLDHQDDPVGVRLVLAKKGQNAPTTLTYAEALLEALCVGWIDGQTQRRDAATWCQKFTPRRSRSLWSIRNVGYVAELIEAGRMQPRGLAEVARAQADGRWEAAYAGPAKIEVPAELSAALAADPAAAASWETLNSQNRYAILHRIHTAVREDTKSRRTQQYVAMLARGETLYPQKRSAPVNPPTEVASDQPESSP